MPPNRSRLFRHDFIRMLLRRATWIEAWSSLKRAHKDKRARRHLLALFLFVSFLILVPVLCLAYLWVLIGTGSWLFIPFVIPVLWWIKRSAKRDFEPLNIAPTPEPLLSTPTVEQNKSLRLYFAELALIYAVFVDRAGSERFLKEKQLPKGVEVISRRAQLDLLRSHGIWERMAPSDREAIMMPDGHWDWMRINQMAMEMEPLRLLRWLLRIDFQLPQIGQSLSGDFTIANELVTAPQKALQGDELAEEQLIRIGAEAAQHYYVRCLAEAITRGYLPPKDDQALQWAKEISESLDGHQDEDLVLGSNLVSEAAREQLMWATTLSQKRSEFLSWSLSLLKEGHPPAQPFPCISCRNEPVGEDRLNTGERS